MTRRVSAGETLRLHISWELLQAPWIKVTNEISYECGLETRGSLPAIYVSRESRIWGYTIINYLSFFMKI